MSRKEIDFDDFILEEVLVKNRMIDDLLTYQDIKNRKLFLNSEVNSGVACELVRFIREYNAEDKGKPTEERKPIYLYIASCGGDTISGFDIVSAIEDSKTPVYTIVSNAYSMAFLISLAGHKRFANRTATYLMHDGYIIMDNSISKARDAAEFQNNMEERTKQYVISKTKITSELYDKNYRNDWYMFADEAKELGVVDSIIGVDCDIDDII